MSFDSVKDSGERQRFSTGSQRDSQAGKGRFDLIPFYMLERLAQHFENGSVKYGDNNWKLGQPLSQYANSGLRHAIKAGEGWLDEDHPAAAMWNFGCFMWTLNEIEAGRLPAELNDIHWQTDGPGAPAKSEEPKVEAYEIRVWPDRIIRTDEVWTMEGKIDDVDPALLDVVFGRPIEPLIPAECFQVDSEGTTTVPEAGGSIRSDFFELAGPVDDEPKKPSRCEGFCIACGDNAWPEKYAVGERVSVRDILKALDGTTFTNGFGDPVARLYPDSINGVVALLDHLEDAGFQVTKA